MFFFVIPLPQDAAVELKSHTATLDRVIVNAAIFVGGGPIQDLNSSDLLENLKTNIVCAHTVTKAFAPFVLASKANARIFAYVSSSAASIHEVSNYSTMMKGAFKIDFIPSSGYLTSKFVFPRRITSHNTTLTTASLSHHQGWLEHAR